MNPERQRFLELLCQQWSHGEVVDTKEVYQSLTEEGYSPGSGDLSELLEDFKNRGLIDGEGYDDKEGAERHGAMAISHIADSTRREYSS